MVYYQYGKLLDVFHKIDLFGHRVKIIRVWTYVKFSDSNGFIIVSGMVTLFHLFLYVNNWLKELSSWYFTHIYIVRIEEKTKDCNTNYDNVLDWNAVAANT